MLLLLLACGTAEPEVCEPEPEPLFGAPVEATGLDTDACRPRCDGCVLDGTSGFTPPAYGPEDVAALRSWSTAPYPELGADPYLTPEQFPAGEGACAVVVQDADARTYALQTFPSEADALAAGAHPTHAGPCGVCSTLTDLAVYMATPDLTAPVRACGVQSLGGGEEALLACIEALGFTRPCAQIWTYNTLNTRDACLGVCLELLDAPYHTPDGALNACLQCDEDQSGPVFKAVAGRTRRNSGLPNAMCRPCAEVWPYAHDYR